MRKLFYFLTILLLVAVSAFIGYRLGVKHAIEDAIVTHEYDTNVVEIELDGQIYEHYI